MLLSLIFTTPSLSERLFLPETGTDRVQLAHLRLRPGPGRRHAPFLLTGAASTTLSISVTLTWPGLLEASGGSSVQATATSLF